MIVQIVAPHYRVNVQKQQTVTTASAALTPLVAADGISTPDNIFVQALSTNTSPIIISSNNPAVAAGPGIELPPGGNTSLPSVKATDWFVVTTAGSQKLNISYQAGLE